MVKPTAVSSYLIYRQCVSIPISLTIIIRGSCSSSDSSSSCSRSCNTCGNSSGNIESRSIISWNSNLEVVVKIVQVVITVVLVVLMHSSLSLPACGVSRLLARKRHRHRG